MKGLFKILLILIALIGFVSCHKYPEDNVFMEFKKPEKRILGSWKISKYLMNGADSTTFLFQQYVGVGIVPYSYGNIISEISANHGEFSLQMTASALLGSGIIIFESKNNILFIGGVQMDAISAYNPFVNTNGNWTIRELTKSSLKIINTINGINYRIEFTKQ